MNYERKLFEVAPWTQEIMQFVKTLNNNSFQRGRTGWIRREIKNPESIYEHSCKLGLAAHYLFENKEAVDKAISHDFPELFEPDHIPWEIDQDEKRSKESAVMDRLSSILPNGDYWLNTWNEFENKIANGQQIFELDKI